MTTTSTWRVVPTWLFGSARSAAVLLTMLLSGPALAQQYRGKLGINLDGAGPSSFVDLAKAARPWEAPGGGTLPPSQLDANGWPTTDFRTVLLDARPVPEWAGTIDDPQGYRVSYSGTHHGSFTGRAVISNGAGPWSIQNQAYNAATNTTTFDLVLGAPGPGHGFVLMQFTNTQRTATAALGSGITNLKVIRAGYPAASTQFFPTALINAINGVNFAAIRAKDLTGTSNIDGIVYPATIDWADRKLPTDAIQAGGLGRKKEGMAWEHFIDLCNQVDKDIWVNIPVSATPNYVTQLATLLKNRLKPTLNIYVENDNEIWNNGGGGFGATYTYNRAQAAALGFTGYGADKQNYARRSVELAQLFQTVFGAGSLNSRVRVVLCWHQPLRKWDVSQVMLPYINQTFGPPKNFIYAIATQTYFNPVNPPANATAAQLVALCRPGIVGLVDEGPTTVNEAGRRQWVQAAQQWQLPGGLMSYEGGPGTAYGEGNTTNIGNAIQMHREPAMKDEVKYNLAQAWWDLGAGLAMQFTLSSGYQRYGQYGLTDDLGNPDRNAKYQAMRELVGGPTTLATTPRAASPDALQLYPNPTAATFRLRYAAPTAQRAQVEVSNTLGQVVHHTSVALRSGPNDLELPAHFLPAGLYHVRLTTAQATATQALQVVR
ncbi:T9SS type A sorting domain-containing protein [Hymenobacter weizhouensis]|uniref:T9SS type A sorting domain-containing protein n=1 Tax=Hymenobacter sp. YIM 151500-1 TaxID=2987689 RepID=UPI002227B44B|nr:T9SS type A sorting domain-containing protein [Hymenobacter sp. YIM 151500-1]UYZ61489.1 T9SS type A sorting domain-containing protein [Hymenobacter sp. YIM 151500-1]